MDQVDDGRPLARNFSDAIAGALSGFGVLAGADAGRRRAPRR
jgi:hypothetical protein